MADNPRLLVRSATRRAERMERGAPASPIKVTLTRTGATTFTQSAIRELLDATDKNTPITTISSFAPQTITNAGLASAADNSLMYAGFRGVVAAGVLRMEDFAISDVTSVPEPASLGVLGLAGVALAARRR